MPYRTHATTRLAMVVAAVLAASASLEAQRPPSRRAAAPRTDTHQMNDGRTAGLSLGIHAIGAPGVSISGEDIDGAFETNFGAGIGATVAYGFTRTFSAFASIDLAKQQTGPDVEPAGNFGLLHVQAGARANLPLGGPATVPYLSASVGRRALGARVTDLDTGESYDSSLSGGMFGLGGGVQHFFSPSLAFDGGVELGFGKLDDLEEDGERATLAVDGSTTIRLRLGLTWRPGIRRST